jgi:hypothetical protein
VVWVFVQFSQVRCSRSPNTRFAGLQRGVVQLPIVVAKVAPVAMKMAAQVRRGIEPALSDQLVDASGHDHLPGRKACL